MATVTCHVISIQCRGKAARLLALIQTLALSFILIKAEERLCSLLALIQTPTLPLVLIVDDESNEERLFSLLALIQTLTLSFILIVNVGHHLTRGSLLAWTSAIRPSFSSPAFSSSRTPKVSMLIQGLRLRPPKDVDSSNSAPSLLPQPTNPT